MTIGQDTCIPGKRLRNWHRLTQPSDQRRIPLRAYARQLARTSDTAADRERQIVARAWLAGKGIQP